MSVVRHLTALQVRIETIAEDNSVPGKTSLELDDTLAALTPAGRNRVKMLLELVRAFSDDADEKAAANHLAMRAARAWYGSSLSFSQGEPAERDLRSD